MKLQKTKKTFIDLLKALVGLVMLVLTGLACLQVFLRYGFDASFFWVEEISVMLMIWMAWLGASLLWMTRGHISVTFLIRNWSVRTRRLVIQATDLLATVGALGFAYASFETLKAFQGMSLGTLDIDAGIKYFPIPVGALFLAAAALVNFGCAGSEVAAERDVR